MTWLLYRLLDRDLADSILGDFEESARERYPSAPVLAALWKWRHVGGVIAAALTERLRDALVAPPAPSVSRWSADLGQDITHALRMLRRNRAFSLAAILTLSLGIGCTTAIFSVVDALLIRSLPYDDADRLVRIDEHVPPRDDGGDLDASSSIEAAAVEGLRARAHTLSHIGFHATTDETMVVQGQTVRITGQRVSASIFEMLHAQPVLGRAFRVEDEMPGAPRSVVLSFAAWHRYFRGSPDALTQRVLLDGELASVVGVMAEDFYFPDRLTEIWTPFVTGPVIGGRWPVLARVRPGVSIEAARDEINALLAGSPDGRGRFEVVQARDALIAPVRPALTVLMISVGLVLLIACTNVANLLVARAVTRQREIAVRRALGAGRLRLVRQVLTESVLLSVSGAVAGVALAVGMIAVLQTIGVGLARSDLGPALSIPLLDEVRIDTAALAFTLSVAVLSGALFGVIPAIEQSQSSAVDLLRGDRGVGFSLAGRRPVQGALIVLQIAGGTVLLVAAGLQIHSFVKLSTVDPGYDASNVLTFQVLFPDDAGPASFAEDFIAEAQRIPGVRAIGYSASLPMVQSAFISPLSLTARPTPPQSLSAGPTPEGPDTRIVSRGFLDALGVKVIEGRGFVSDRQSSGLRPILINRALARSGYLGPTPIGQHVYAGGRPAEVVGIIDDVRQFGLDRPADPQVFALMTGGTALYYAVRTTTRPASNVVALQQIVRRLAPDADLYNVATMDQIVASSVGRRRLYAALMATFGTIAAILAAVGVYGMVAYAAARRTREIGIRVALGAHPRRVLALIMRDATALVAIGLPIGLAGAAGLARSFDAMLFDLTPLDPATYAGVSLFFTLVALTAAFAAARRATTVDPVVALRSE